MTAVEIKLLGKGRFAGAQSNVAEYKASESATSLNLSAMRGGVGEVEFTVVEDPTFQGTVALPGEKFRLTDPYAGAIDGVIDAITAIDQAGVSASGSTLLLPLVATRDVGLFSGTLGAAITYYMSLCGVNGAIQIDPDIASKQVALPSWTGEVWNGLKKLAAIHQFEIAAVGNAIIIRKPRTRMLEVNKYNTLRFTSGGADATREVEVHYYNNQYKADQQIYPDPESSIVDRNIMSLGAGETVTTNYQVNMWIQSIDQPTHILNLPWDNTATSSVYSVVDKDGVSVTPEDWRNGGGLVEFKIGPDGKSVDVTARGMFTQDRGPYRLAGTSEDLEYQYAALYIAATGITFKDEVMTTRTGAAEDVIPVDSITVIDEPMVSTRLEAATVMMSTALSLSGEQQTLEATSTSVNRRGETGEIVYPSFGEFDALNPTTTFGQFDATWPTQTFAQFDAYQASLVAGKFESQAFGGVAGARVRYRDAMYRAETASISPGKVDWSSLEDTTFGDWEEAMDDAAWDPTFGQYDTMWGTGTFAQQARQPLAAPLV